MDANCYMTQFNLSWYCPHGSHINSPPRWHFSFLCKRTQLYWLTGSYDQWHRKKELWAQGKKTLNPIFYFLMMHLHCKRCHLSWQCSPALPTWHHQQWHSLLWNIWWLRSLCLHLQRKLHPCTPSIKCIHHSFHSKRSTMKGPSSREIPFGWETKKYKAGLSLCVFSFSPLS